MEEHALLECLELAMPWLTPAELATLSSTCKTLNHISKSITFARASDASRSFENLPVPFVNACDAHPYAYFHYTPSQILPSQSSLLRRQPWGSNNQNSTLPPPGLILPYTGEESGCGCESCGCECLCGGFVEGSEVMSECGPGCGCGLNCENRVTQRGVSVGLKIVRDEKKGWGLHAAQFIPKGQFVCEYAGELLTTEQARRRQQMYDELSSGGRYSSALLVVREHLPSGKACLRMNIDGTRIGNVARFINHSCDGGNLLTVLVRSSGALLPRLCFFASKNIQEDEELTFSYGDIRIREKGLPCFCGSSCCFGVLPSENT